MSWFFGYSFITMIARASVNNSPLPILWYLLTDWPVTTEAEALRVLRFYRRRWAVEDTFKFIKTCCGVEAVQLLRLGAICRLVAFAWVAAGFLFYLGVTLDNAAVRLLAHLGGWEPRANRPPGKRILTRG
ncbi:MAG: transposase, partial [Aggregatilineales bacterium]